MPGVQPKHGIGLRAVPVWSMNSVGQTNSVVPQVGPADTAHLTTSI